MVFQGKFKAPVFVTFMQRLLKQVVGNIYLIVGGHPVRKFGRAKRVDLTRRCAADSDAGLLPGTEPQ